MLKDTHAVSETSTKAIAPDGVGLHQEANQAAGSVSQRSLEDRLKLRTLYQEILFRGGRIGC